MYHITLDLINEKRDNLNALSTLNEYAIQKMWRLSSEEELDGFIDLKYDYRAPLYQKMVFRFWQNKCSPSAFWNALDPSNRQLLAYRYNSGDKESEKLLNFFAWINNYFTREGLLALFCGDVPSPNVDKIADMNEIKLFFFLDRKSRAKIVDNYNDFCNR